MAADISPELYRKIIKRFDELRLADKQCESLRELFRSGAATYREGGKYAERVGKHLSQALRETLTEEALPNGKLYYNIAQNTLGKALYLDADLIDQTAKQIQTGINKKAGIGLKPANVPVDKERINGLVNAAANAKTFEETVSALGSPVVFFSQNVMDSNIRANAELQTKAGLSVRVEREYDDVGLHDGTDICEFCKKREGTWTFEQAMRVGAFERHENCGCTIDYTTRKGRKQRQTDWKQNKWKNVEKQEDGVKIGLGDRIIESPTQIIKNYSPETLKKELEKEGYNVRALGRGKLKGIQFEDGGGYRTNWGGDNYLQYHPEKFSHHGGEYYKVSDGKNGKRYYDTDGNQFRP